MIGDYLPPVVTELKGDIEDLAAKVQEAKALIKSLAGDVEVTVKFTVDPASYAAAKAAADSLRADGPDIPIGFKVNMASYMAAYTEVRALMLAFQAEKIEINFDVNFASLAAAITEINTLNAVVNTAGGAARAAGAGFRIFGTGLALTRTAIHWIIAGTSEFLAVFVPAMIALGAGMLVAAQGAQNLQNHFQALYVATEATYPVFHQTIGTVLGLGDALQRAQNQANPGVYEILGAVINGTTKQFQTFAQAGLDVVHAFDEFAARVDVDIQQGLGGQVHALLANMVTDLVELGQVLGNLGHAFFNFIAAMPGLAEVLLAIVDAISKVILWVSQLAPWLITAAMAMEEFYRWGGLLARLLPLIASGLVALGPAVVTGVTMVFATAGRILSGFVTAIGLLINGAGRLLSLIPIFQSTGAAVQQFGTDVTYLGNVYAAGFTWVGAAIIALVGLGIAFDKVRNSSQQFIDANNQAIASAQTNVQALGDVVSGIIQASVRIEAQKSILAGYSQGMQTVGNVTGGLITNLQSMNSGLGGAAQGVQNVTSHFGGLSVALGAVMIPMGLVAPGSTEAGIALVAMGNGATTAASQIDQLTAHQRQLVSEGNTAISNAEYLAKTYGVSLGGAFALADQSGIKLTQTLQGNSQAAQIARQQVANLVTSYGALAKPTGALAVDMDAVAIQSGIAGSKVQTLTQDMSALMQLITSGTSNFAGLISSMQQLSSGVSTASTSVRAGTSSVSSATGNLKATLQGLGPAAMQTWQQFDAAITGPGQNLINWFDTALSLGKITGPVWAQSLRDIAAQFLPIAKHSRAATAEVSALNQQAGGKYTDNWKKLSQEIGIKAPAAARQLDKEVGVLTPKLANIGSVAQAVGSAIMGQLVSALGQAFISVSNIDGKFKTWIQTLENSNSTQSQVKTATDNVTTALKGLGLNNQQVNQIMQTGEGMARNQGNAFQTEAGQARGLATAASAVAGSIRSIPTNWYSTIHVNTDYINARPGVFRAKGGVLPGYSPGHDTIPAWLSPGEGILTPQAVRMIGASNVLRLNRMARGYAGGGIIPGGTPTYGMGQVVERQPIVIQLDGHPIYEAVKEITYYKNVQNNARSGRGTVYGRMTPR